MSSPVRVIYISGENMYQVVEFFSRESHTPRSFSPPVYCPDLDDDTLIAQAWGTRTFDIAPHKMPLTPIRTIWVGEQLGAL
jgi:hypothetical protein